MQKFNISFKPANLQFQVETDCSEIEDYLSHVYKDMLVRKDFIPQHIMKINIKHQNEYFVTFPDKDISSTNNICTVLMWINKEIKKAYSVSDYWPFHGGIIYKNKRKAILLFGQSGSGKSTLCFYLLTKRYNCPTDDLVFINKYDLHIVPMPTSINLRDNVINLFRQEDHRYFDYNFPDINGDNRWVVNAKRRQRNIELAAIINVTFNRNENRLQRLNTFESIGAILKNSYSSSDMSLNYAMTSHIVKKFEVYQMQYSSCENALNYVEQILNH